MALIDVLSRGRLECGFVRGVPYEIAAGNSNPVRSNVPAAWMDMADVIRGRAGAEQKSCKEKVALYLKGVVGIRPTPGRSPAP